MGDFSRRGLGCSYPGNAADDCVVWESSAEGLLVADAVLDDDEGGLIVYSRLEEWRYLGWSHCFVGADDIVEWRCDFVW